MDTLPVEIILAIVSYVSDIGDKVRLLRVCRCWRDLFFHIAYNRVDIDGSLFEPLTKVVLDNPRIGAAIRHLSVTAWDSYTHAHDMDDSLPEAVEELVEQISESPEEQREWTQDLLGRSEEAWLALLLTVVPNLAIFSGSYCGDAPRVTRTVARAARKESPFNTRPALQRLATLHMSCDELKTVYPHWQFLPYFHLPSLRDVDLSAVKEAIEWRRLDHPAVSSASGTAPVESLVLECQCNGRNGMAELISSCANLKQFKYQHDHQEIWGESYIDFQPRKFYRALLTQKHSLEVLHLSDTGDVAGMGEGDLSDNEDDDGPEAYDRWFGSLAEFSQLQDLRIRAQNLLNYHDRDKDDYILLKDVLPRSLRSLHVAECREEHCAMLVPNLQGVLDHEEQFPSIEEISIATLEADDIPAGPNRSPLPPQYRIRESFMKLFVPVKELCGRAGVTFEISAWICSVE